MTLSYLTRADHGIGVVVSIHHNVAGGSNHICKDRVSETHLML